MGADARHWPQDLHFFEDQFSPIYAVTSHDLEDDRWTVRAWHADRWLRRLWRRFTVKDITQSPARSVGRRRSERRGVRGGAETGNANLLEFLCDGCFENGEPRRYEDVRAPERRPARTRPGSADQLSLRAPWNRAHVRRSSAKSCCSMCARACARRPAGSRRPSARCRPSSGAAGWGWSRAG